MEKNRTLMTRMLLIFTDLFSFQIRHGVPKRVIEWKTGIPEIQHKKLIVDRLEWRLHNGIAGIPAVGHVLAERLEDWKSLKFYQICIF